MEVFVFAFGVLTIACSVLYAYTRKVQQQSKDPYYQRFQQVYLIVYLLAIGKINKFLKNR
jgi:cytochrome bd-type quinol oxidase subunit 1